MWGESSLVHGRLVRIGLHQAFCSLSQGLCGWGGRIPNILQLLIWKPFSSCEYFRYFVLVLKPHQKHKANFNFWLKLVPGAVKRVATKQALFMGGLEIQPCKWWWGDLAGGNAFLLDVIYFLFTTTLRLPHQTRQAAFCFLDGEYG